MHAFKCCFFLNLQTIFKKHTGKIDSVKNLFVLKGINTERSSNPSSTILKTTLKSVIPLQHAGFITIKEDMIEAIIDIKKFV